MTTSQTKIANWGGLGIHICASKPGGRDDNAK